MPASESVVGSTPYFLAICAYTGFSPGLSDSTAASAASIEFILIELHVVEVLVLHARIARFAVAGVSRWPVFRGDSR
jgi:hypothetical protein